MSFTAEEVTLGAQAPELRAPAIGVAPPVDDLRQPTVDDRLPVAKLVVAEQRGRARLEVLGRASQQAAPLLQIEVQLADAEVPGLQRVDQQLVERQIPEQHVEHDALHLGSVPAPSAERRGAACLVVETGQGTRGGDLQQGRRLRLHELQEGLADAGVRAESEQGDLLRAFLQRQAGVQRAGTRSVECRSSATRSATPTADARRRAARTTGVAGESKKPPRAPAPAVVRPGVVPDRSTPSARPSSNAARHGSPRPRRAASRTSAGRSPVSAAVAAAPRWRTASCSPAICSGVPAGGLPEASNESQRVVSAVAETGQHRVSCPSVLCVSQEDRQQALTGLGRAHRAERQRGLHANAGVGVVCHRRDRGAQGRGVVQMSLRQRERALADAGRRVPQRALDLVDLESPEST